MMSFDERVAFHSYMQSGAEKECKGLYELALSDYKLAKGIAMDAKDNCSVEQVLTRIEGCQEKIESQEK